MKRREYIYLFLLALVSCVLFYANYIPGTFLLGWDNLMPELNFKANFARSMASVWQEYRGLGVEDGMAHAANLLHTSFLYLLSFIFPQNMLRYIFHFGIHLFGGIGMYLLLVEGLKRKREVAFIGALFYMLNLATIQIFFAPLEVFSTHFGFLPWLVLSALNIIHTLNKKNVLLFFLLSILATPQGFVPTVFIAYLFVLGSITFSVLFKEGKKKLIRILVVLFITFISNSFWLMPFVHGALTQGTVIQNAKINQMSSEEIFEKNKYRGKITDVLYMRGFMLDITENNVKKEFVYIMKEWNTHNNQPFVVAISSLFMLCTLFGFSKTILYLKHKEKYSGEAEYFVPLFLVGLLLLATNTPLLAQINDFLRIYVPFFGEAFRFPYTKFFIMYAFSYTIFFVFGLEQLINKFHSHKRVYLSLWIFFCVAIILYALPAFQGNFFYEVERIKIPKQYFDVIAYFKKEKSNARIMTLPQPIFWNWPYYQWGARGSGFLWYGIEQPMLERPFDPWSNYNEQYFNELFYALQTENRDLFIGILSKYDISFILVDETIINTNKIQNADKLIEKIQSWLPNSKYIEFKSIKVFKLNTDSAKIIAPSTIAVATRFENEYMDQAYEDYGSYYLNKKGGTSYLFPSLFSNKTQQNIEYELNKKDSYIEIKSRKENFQYEALQQGGSVNIPLFNSKEFYTPAVVEYFNNDVLIRPLSIRLIIGEINKEIMIFAPTSLHFNDSPPKAIKINGEEVLQNEIKYILLLSNHNNIISTTSNGKEEVNTDIKLSFNDNSFQLDSFNMDIQPLLSIESYLLEQNAIAAKSYELLNPCPEDVRGGLALSTITSNGVSLEANRSTNCLNVFFKSIPQQSGSLLWVEVEHKNGMRPSILVDNPEQKSISIETKLNSANPYNSIIVPPTSPFLYSGYGVHIRNESPGNTSTQNIIKDISAYYLPYSWMKTLRTENSLNKYINILDSCIHKKVFQYICQLTNTQQSNDSIFYISQSYNENWKAYELKVESSKLNWLQENLPFLFGTEVTNHVLVNNWANGWVMDSLKVQKSESQKSTTDTHIVIVFWPQYLQYLGFILLGATCIGIALYRNKSH